MRFPLFLLVPSLAWAAEPPKPALPQGDKYACVLTPGGCVAEVLLPDGASGNIAVTPLSRALQGKLTGGGINAPDGALQMVLITIAGKEIPPAEYKVELAVGKSSYVTLLTVPPAALIAVPTKIQINQTFVPLLGWACPLASCELKLPISPADPKMHLTGLHAAMAEAFLKDGGVTSGTLTPTVSPQEYNSVEPEKGPQLTLRAAGDFKRGESQGKVRVFADQFPQPVTIPVTVLSTPTSLVLIPILIAGLALGYLIRVRLEEQINKQTALVDVRRFLERIKHELASKHDPDLERQLLAIQKELEDQSAAKAAELRTALEAAGPKLTKSLSDFETRKSDFLTDAGALFQIVHRRFLLPPRLAAVIENAKNALSQVITVPGNDVAAAKQRLTAEEDRLMLAARDALREWNVLWHSRKAVVEQLSPLLLAEDRARVQTDFDSAQSAHAKVVDFLLATAPNRQQLLDALETVHRNNMLLPPLLGGLPLRLQQAIERFQLAMKDLNRAAEPEWLAWRQLADHAVESVRTLDPDAANELRVLRAKLQETLRALAPAEPEVRLRLINHLEKNEFVLAIALLKPRPAPESVPRLERAERPGPPIPPVVVVASEPGDPPPSRPAPVIPGEPVLLAEIEQLEMWRRIAIGILIVLFAWVVLRVSFRGEPLEYLTAFGWALLTDLTTASLITTFTPLKDKVKVP